MTATPAFAIANRTTARQANTPPTPRSKKTIASKRDRGKPEGEGPVRCRERLFQIHGSNRSEISPATDRNSETPWRRNPGHHASRTDRPSIRPQRAQVEFRPWAPAGPPAERASTVGASGWNSRAIQANRPAPRRARPSIVARNLRWGKTAKAMSMVETGESPTKQHCTGWISSLIACWRHAIHLTSYKEIRRAQTATAATLIPPRFSVGHPPAAFKPDQTQHHPEKR